MKQIVQNYRTGELQVEEVPAPNLQSDGLLVATEFSLISAGTEKSTVTVAKKNLAGKAMERPDLVKKVINQVQKDGLADTMKMVFGRLDKPGALGYSCAGIVKAVGNKVTGFSIGDRVACAGQNYASHAELNFIPKNLCVKIPDGVDSEAAAYVALGSIALQGVRQAEPKLGEFVAVIGLGLLGQLVVQMLKANGCIVIATDIDPTKLELAKKFGADQTILADELENVVASVTQSHGVDSVIITASTKDNTPIEVAGEICRKKGRVVIVGAVGMNVPRESYYKKELELRLSTSYGPGRYDTQYEEQGQDYPYAYVRWTEQRNMIAFLNLIQQGKIDVKSLTSHSYAIESAQQAYELIMRNTEPYLGILLSYNINTYKEEHKINIIANKKTELVNIGLIGAGNHIQDRLLPYLKKLKDIQISAVCTGTGINSKALAKKIKATYCTNDYKDILKDKNINAVLIGTRHNTHGQIIIEALKAGKHIFVEKPLCLTENELEEITASYADKGLQIMVGFNRRYSSHGKTAQTFFADHKEPLVMAFRVNAGAIPEEHWIQNPEIGGGRIIGEACHFIDYMQFICGAKVVSVYAKRISHHSSGITDDQSILSLSFADGSIGTIIYAAGGDKALAKEHFEVFGDGKSLVMEDFTISEFYEGGKKTSFKTRKCDKGFKNEMLHFKNIIMNGESIPFDEIYATTKASLLAVKSFQTGKSYNI